MQQESQQDNLIPRYQIIANVLQSEIENGIYDPGERLASESDLSRRFSENRYTIRHALNLLEKIGLIYSHQGKGHFVSEKPLTIHYTITPNMKYSDVITSLGRTPSMNIIKQSISEAPFHISKALHLEKGEKVIHLEILRYVDETPLSYNVTWLNRRYLPNFFKHMNSIHSLYELIEDVYGFRLHRISSSFKTTYPTGKEAAFLNISPTMNLLTIDSIMRNEKMEMIEYTSAKYRGDLCQVSVEFEK